MKKLIVYHTKYGSTRDYAEWLAESTGAELVPLAEAKQLDLAGYDAVVFGCPYYAFRLKIAGFVKSWVPRLAGRRLAFFGVGGAAPDSPHVRKVYEAALPEGVRARLEFFYLRGRITLAKMSAVDRLTMKVLRAQDEDHVDRSALAPLVEFLSETRG